MCGLLNLTNVEDSRCTSLRVHLGSLLASGPALALVLHLPLKCGSRRLGLEFRYFTTDKAYGRAAVSQGGVGKRWKNHGVFLRYSYSLGLILPLLASDTPVLALDGLRA